jgi:hypothetical protein
MVMMMITTTTTIIIIIIIIITYSPDMRRTKLHTNTRICPASV